MIGLSLGIGYVLQNTIWDDRSQLLLIFGSLAGLLAGFVTFPLTNLLSKLLPKTSLFAFVLVFLAGFSLVFTFCLSLFYTFQYVSRFHDPFGTGNSLKDLLLLTLVHGYSFVAVMLRLFVPVGLISLFGISFAFIRRIS